MRPATILAIESSCDETAAAVVRGRSELLSNCVYSQIDLHKIYGGVVPEIASRAHVEKIDIIAHAALLQAGVALGDLDAIAVTQGPGLVGALLVGVSFAKGLALALDKPLIGVNHIEGHMYANVLTHPDLRTPYVCLVVSGGHSHLLRVEDGGDYRLLGSTQDDAAGEAFDKAARVLGLAYPGGPNLDALAERGDSDRFMLPTPKVEGRYDYSFSGLKTAFINLCHQMDQRGEELPREDLAASFRQAVVRQLLHKAMLAIRDGDEKRFALAGGVAANQLLRTQAMAECEKLGIELYLPELRFCGDNAAMIAAAAQSKYERGQFADLRLNASPTLRLLT